MPANPSTSTAHQLGDPQLKDISPAVRERVESYTRGINAYLESDLYRAPIEFTLLQMEKPETWTAGDVLQQAYLLVLPTLL